MYGTFDQWTFSIYVEYLQHFVNASPLYKEYMYSSLLKLCPNLESSPYK